MIKRIVEISKSKTYLSIKYDQLVITQERQVVSKIPCEDIGVLLLDHSGITCTHSVFTKLLENKAAIIICDKQHLPAGLFLPLNSSVTETQSFTMQINASKPTKKRIWQQLVKAKIYHQASVLEDEPIAHNALKELAKQVRAGDPSNVEARASKRYWKSFLKDEKFTRSPEGIPPNNLLNYGYMVMRAAVARSLSCAGLLPNLGVHHHNKYNAYCLADDLVEPFRGYIDKRVRELWFKYDHDRLSELTQDIKAELLEVLYQEVEIGGNKGPLFVGLHRVCASLKRCLSGEDKNILLPKI